MKLAILLCTATLAVIYFNSETVQAAALGIESGSGSKPVNPTVLTVRTTATTRPVTTTTTKRPVVILTQPFTKVKTTASTTTTTRAPSGPGSDCEGGGLESEDPIDSEGPDPPPSSPCRK